MPLLKCTMQLIGDVGLRDVAAVDEYAYACVHCRVIQENLFLFDLDSWNRK